MTLPKARTRNVDSRRHYVAHYEGTEVLIPSASTLASQLDKPAITGWEINRHLVKAHELSRKARGLSDQEFKGLVRGAVRRDGNPQAESGTRAHEVIEAVLTGSTIPEHPETPWAAKHAAELAEEMKLEPIMVTDDRSGVELTVARVEDGVPIWAGTSDFIGRWEDEDGEHTGSVDWKSGKSGLWPESILSTSVYSGATHWVEDHSSDLLPLPVELTAGALVWVRPEGWAWCPISEDETAYAIEVCRSLAILQRWRMHARIADPVNAAPIRKGGK